MSSGHLGAQDQNGMGGMANSGDGSGGHGFAKGGGMMGNGGGTTSNRSMVDIEYNRQKFKTKLYEVYVAYFKNRNETMPDIAGFINTKESDFYKAYYLQKNNNIEEYQKVCS